MSYIVSIFKLQLS